MTFLSSEQTTFFGPSAELQAFGTSCSNNPDRMHNRRNAHRNAPGMMLSSAPRAECYAVVQESIAEGFCCEAESVCAFCNG